MNAGMSRCWRNRRRTTIASGSFSAAAIASRRRSRPCRPRRSRTPSARSRSCRGPGAAGWRPRRAPPPCPARAAGRRSRRRRARSRRGRWPASRAITTATPSPAKCTVSTASGGACGAFWSGGDRPGVGQARLGQPEVGRGVDGDDAGQRPGLVGVDAGDPGVRRGRAHHGQVQHAGQRDVVGPAGAPGDEAGVLLAGAGLPELQCRVVGSAVVVMASAPCHGRGGLGRDTPASSPARRSARPARCSGSRCTGRGCPRCPRGPRARPGRGCRRAGRPPA